MMGQRFTPLYDFYSEDTRSHYHKGYGYTVDNDRLAALVERWVADGKVALGGASATLTGKG